MRIRGSIRQFVEQALRREQGRAICSDRNIECEFVENGTYLLSREQMLAVCDVLTDYGDIERGFTVYDWARFGPVEESYGAGGDRERVWHGATAVGVYRERDARI